MGEEYISREEALRRLGVSGEELDRLVFEGRISPVQEEGEQRFRTDDVDGLRAEMREEAEPALDIGRAKEGEAGEEAFFDFTQELELEGEKPEGEAVTQLEPTQVSAGAESVGGEETVPDAVEEEEEGEEEADILADILEEEAAGELAEETVEVPETEEETSEITRLEEETYEGEEVEEVIAAEEGLGYAEEEGEEFEIPYGVPVGAEPAAPVGGLTVALLVMTLVALVWAAVLVSESVLGTSSALTDWLTR